MYCLLWLTLGPEGLRGTQSGKIDLRSLLCLKASNWQKDSLVLAAA